MRRQLIGVFLLTLIVLTSLPLVAARVVGQDDAEDIRLGSNVDFLITVSSSVLALCLFVVSVMAYAYTRRGRMLFVTAAFFLFAFKDVLVAVTDAYTQGILSGQTMAWIAPFAQTAVHLSRVLDLGVLLLFFFGLIKK